MLITTDTPAASVPRPSELFYNKLTPLLEADGLSADPRQRSQWPIDTLRRVLTELMDETPKDLVARYLEIWNSFLITGRFITMSFRKLGNCGWAA